MDYFAEPLDTVYKQLATSPSGLSDDEANARIAHHGKNVISVKSEPLWRIIAEPFRSIFVFVLFAAAAISVMHHAYLDAAIVVAIVLVNATIFYIQRYSTHRILRSLQKKNTDTAAVVRANKHLRISSSLLVPGDIIILDEGDKVPADARIIESHSCRVNESQLTGESLPIEKTNRPTHRTSELYERACMIYQGSFIIGGMAHAVVVATGNDTEFGQLAKLSATPYIKSPVEQKIDKLVTHVIAGVTAMAVVAFILALARGIEFSEALRFVMALAVSAVPESLSIAITVVLAIGMRKMAAKKALVRTMSAIENIGEISTIATDKTGTLTKNKPAVSNIVPLFATKPTLLRTLQRSTIPADKLKVRDPLDIAFEAYAPHDAQPLQTYPFEHAVGVSGAIYHNGGTYALYVKGAPEKIVLHSNLTDTEREKALITLNTLTSDGLRVVALAHVSLQKAPTSLEQIAKVRFNFDGYVGIADALRSEARGAIAQAQRAGITVRMITGDHFETAYHISRKLGLATSRDDVFDCRNLHRLSDKQLEAVILRTKVFSRVLPEQKYQILTTLKAHGITAMTGDGVNDVPALTKADVGIAMGSGVSITRDASDIILLDDNFRSIVTAIHEGRAIYANIKRIIGYLLATNFGEVLVSIGSLLLGLPLPFTPIQILWINLVTDTCLVIPLGMEPAEKNVMRQAPLRAGAPLLERRDFIRTITVAVTMAGVVLGIYLTALPIHTAAYASTLAFHAIVVMQWANAFGFRSDTEWTFKRLGVHNRAFYIGLTIAILLQALTLFTSFGGLLSLTPIAIKDFAVTTFVGFIAPLIVLDLLKIIRRRQAS